MRKLDEAMQSGILSKATIGKASKAAQSIYKWVIAIMNYYFVYNECKPKRDELIFAEIQIIDKTQKIEAQKQMVKAYQDKLA